MVRTDRLPSFDKLDYGYGDHSPIDIIRFKPVTTSDVLDPHASLELPSTDRPPFTEVQLKDKVGEVVHNYTAISDPESTESQPKQFGFTVANKDKMLAGIPGILLFTTNASSIYDEEFNPNNEGNVLEQAYAAFYHPELPIYLIESPGTGNSVDFTDDEYSSAAKDGRLVSTEIDDEGRITSYEAFPTLQAIRRALEAAGVSIGYISANATGAHIGAAFETTLEPGSIEKSFLYNPTNISDRTFIGFNLAAIREVITQGRYKSHDPLQLTDERKAMAKAIMSDRPKRKLDQIRAQTHNPRKLLRQSQIWRRGDRHGQAAAVHGVAAQMQHPEARHTYVLPQFAAQYKSPEDFDKFVQAITKLGGFAREVNDIESLLTPLGQYGHSHFPTVRQTLESYAFERE